MLETKIQPIKVSIMDDDAAYIDSIKEMLESNVLHSIIRFR